MKQKQKTSIFKKKYIKNVLIPRTKKGFNKYYFNHRMVSLGPPEDSSQASHHLTKGHNTNITCNSFNVYPFYILYIDQSPFGSRSGSYQYLFSSFYILSPDIHCIGLLSKYNIFVIEFKQIILLFYILYSVHNTHAWILIRKKNRIRPHSHNFGVDRCVSL